VVVRATYHLEHVPGVIPAAGAGVVSVIVGQGEEPERARSRGRYGADAPVRVAGARLLVLLRQGELVSRHGNTFSVSVRESSVR
jgi:hypothetical protein